VAILEIHCFQPALTSILNAFPFDAVDAAEFKDHLSEATGIDLTSFFDDWIYAPGFADYEINSVDITPNGEQFDVFVEIQQKLLAAPHFHTNAPMEITFFDENQNLYTERFMVSGEISSTEFTLPFAPVMQILNDNNLLNLGRTQNRLLIEEPGLVNVDYTNFFQFQVNELQEPVMLNVVHHLTGADPSESPYVDAVSSSHYWTVNGFADEVFNAKVTLQYQGQNEERLDFDLLGDTEEDLILLWRPTPEDAWSEYPYYEKLMLGSTTDGNGFIRIEPFLMGEYTFANGNFPVAANDIGHSNQLTIFPNPASTSFYAEGRLDNGETNFLQLFSLDGKQLFHREIAAAKRFSEHIPLTDLAEGTYLVKLISIDGIELANEKVIIVK
jgi:hypothetical protein